MAVYTSAKDLAAAQKRRAARVKQGMEAAQAHLAREMQAKGRALLSGSLSEKTLAALGHPFARQGGGSLPLLPINRQGGGVSARLELTKAAGAGGKIIYTLRDTDPAAAFVLAIGGTRFMRARGFWPALGAYYPKIAPGAFRNAKRRAQQE